MSALEKLRLLDDGKSRPVTMVEREICGTVADAVEQAQALLSEAIEQADENARAAKIARSSDEQTWRAYANHCRRIREVLANGLSE